MDSLLSIDYGNASFTLSTEATAAAAVAVVIAAVAAVAVHSNLWA